MIRAIARFIRGIFGKKPCGLCGRPIDFMSSTSIIQYRVEGVLHEMRICMECADTIEKHALTMKDLM